MPKVTFLALEILINEFKKSEIRRNCCTKTPIILNFKMKISRNESFMQEKLFFANFVWNKFDRRFLTMSKYSCYRDLKKRRFLNRIYHKRVQTMIHSVFLRSLSKFRILPELIANLEIMGSCFTLLEVLFRKTSFPNGDYRNGFCSCHWTIYAPFFIPY